MNPRTSLTRRAALKTAALGALTFPSLGAAAGPCDEKAKKKAGKPAEEVAPEPANPSSPDGRENGLRLGVASYSTRSLTLDETIAVLKVLRIRNTALFKNHCNWEGGT